MAMPLSSIPFAVTECDDAVRDGQGKSYHRVQIRRYRLGWQRLGELVVG